MTDTSELKKLDSEKSADGDKRLSLQPPRGTNDLIPPETSKWQYIEATFQRGLENAGYREVRPPIFEHTELFKRGVGETTDIVNKEMYTFLDKSDRSLTLRPEGTAGTVRAYLHGGMHRISPPVKLWYKGPMFRYERVQTGRYRQFYQIGLEAFGSAGPLIDAEVLLVAVDIFAELGITDFEVQLNSIGCPDCRPAYRNLLKEHLRPRLDKLCADCNDRFERNPLRMLDCKVDTCQAQYTDAPTTLDHLCEACKAHWQGLLNLLAKQNLKIVIKPRLVRGLDYYTRTVFEFVSNDKRLGTQTSIGSGGRYDNLVEMFGGPATPAVGWGLGVDRLLLVLGDTDTKTKPVYIVATEAQIALDTARQLRKLGVACDLDFPAIGEKLRNFSKQLQQANKSGARYVVILGEEEVAQKQATIKDMQSGEQSKIELSQLAQYLQNRSGD